LNSYEFPEAGTDRAAWQPTEPDALEQAATAGSQTEASFHALVSPLLEVVAKLSGLDTTFVTHIDWEAQQQHVLMARNGSSPLVMEGTTVDWADSMCRRIFLSGSSHTSNVGGDFPDSVGATTLGLGTFFALPIEANTGVVGTLCGASRRQQELSPSTMDLLDLIAQAITVQVESEIHRSQAEQRARSAEREMAAALSLASELQTDVVELRSQATTDPLTELANRRGFLAGYERQLADSGRYRRPVGVLMIDVDNFKHVNDRHGHTTGDRVLRALAGAMKRSVRSGDLSARLGGDELAVVAGDADLPACRHLAGRIQSTFSEVTASFGVPSTVSVGIASSTATAPDQLLTAADRALYRSKAAGRGQITLWDGNGDENGDEDLSGDSTPPMGGTPAMVPDSGSTGAEAAPSSTSSGGA